MSPTVNDDPLARMNGEIYQEYRALRAEGMALDPGRFLAVREQTDNYKHTRIFVEDTGTFFQHAASRTRYRMTSELLLCYLSGLPMEDEQAMKTQSSPVYTTPEGLKFWRREDGRFYLVGDTVGGQEFLPEDKKSVVKTLEQAAAEGDLVLKPMLKPKRAAKVIDLDSD